MTRENALEHEFAARMGSSLDDQDGGLEGLGKPPLGSKDPVGPGSLLAVVGCIYCDEDDGSSTDRELRPCSLIMMMMVEATDIPSSLVLTQEIISYLCRWEKRRNCHQCRRHLRR